jgi:2-polyprenyl-6-hydroxyphenyl methylase/3-demethylubiquinone-9 3-methyltransferase
MSTTLQARTRFEFGKNWQSFLNVVDEDRIARAETSLRDMLQRGDLAGLRFLDVGSGSGLFSLAACRLGATVDSFDFDPQSVTATTLLRERFFARDDSWRVFQGSVLDLEFLQGLGKYDVVYAWGVLHHTGEMWRALEHVVELTASEGRLYIAIYNDQGWRSDAWRAVKRTYCALPPWLRWIVLVPAAFRLWAPTLVRDSLRGDSLRTWREFRKNRGMSAWHDLHDWVGGYPFEVATPATIIDFFHQRGFRAQNVRVIGGIGCNEYVFVRFEKHDHDT